MDQTGLFPFDTEAFDRTALETARSMVEGLMRTVCIAQLLLGNGRSVDMRGLERGVGLACAKALDLPPEGGRALRPHLAALLEQVDELTAALRSSHAA